MHGSILSTLRDYVVAKHGPGSWGTVTKAAGLQEHPYVPARAYPDSEALALVAAAAQLGGSSPTMMLQGFGEFLAPVLLKRYEALILPAWTTLDLVENAETTIHRVVRLRNAEASPPQLRCARPSADEVTVTYTSERKMCALATGLVLGIAAHYKEQVEVTEPSCMHRGDPACLIRVKRVP